MFQQRELRRWRKSCCKILRKHARMLMVIRLPFAPRAFLQIFITTTLHHRLAGLCSDRFASAWVRFILLCSPQKHLNPRGFSEIKPSNPSKSCSSSYELHSKTTLLPEPIGATNLRGLTASALCARLSPSQGVRAARPCAPSTQNHMTRSANPLASLMRFSQ
jgi:hypothetical protein